MSRDRLLIVIFAVLALLALGMGADAFFAARSTQNELAAAVATAEASTAVTNDLISNIKVSPTLEPAHEMDVPNVAYDPANVPAPITRTCLLYTSDAADE